MERPKWLHVQIFGFNGLQKKQRRFVEVAGIKDTNDSLMKLLREEVVELAEALPTGDKKDISSEIGDAFHLLTRLADLNGIKVRRSVDGKHRRNMDKYNPKRIRRLQTEWGMSPEEAMLFAKSRWDKRRDNDYL